MLMLMLFAASNICFEIDGRKDSLARNCQLILITDNLTAQLKAVQASYENVLNWYGDALTPTPGTAFRSYLRVATYITE